MAIIKFNSEKADILIKELTQISSDIESNLGKVYSNSYGKEISLYDSRLKVYAYRNKTIDVVQEDNTVVQEVIRERYLKHDYVSYARAYNQYVRNLYKKSSSAKTKATKAIESVINSLRKVKSLINEFESERDLTFVGSLDDVGQFDFNFLASYGPMGQFQSYSSSLGAVVADHAYTSDFLGILGERPTALKLEKLPIFDSIFEIAISNSMSPDEKLSNVKDILLENCLNADPDVVNQKAASVIGLMASIASSKENVIDDDLRIRTLVDLDIPVIENLPSNDLAILVMKEDLRDAKLNYKEGYFGEDMEKRRAAAASVIGALGSYASEMAAEKQVDAAKIDIMGIKSDVELSKDIKDGTFSNATRVDVDGNQNKIIKDVAKKVENGDGGRGGSYNDGRGQTVPQQSKPNVGNTIEKTKVVSDRGQDIGKIDTFKQEIKDKNINDSLPKGPQEPVKEDVPSLSKIEEPIIEKKIEVSAEAKALEEEIQTTRIEMNKNDATISQSNEASSTEIKLDDNVEKKGAGLIAGAAGLGAISNMGGGNNSSMPQVNGMAAGEILGINTTSDATNMGMMIGGTTNSSSSTGTVANTNATTATVGGESTSDRGSLNTGGKTNKPTGNTASGRGGSTLEDKDDSKNENSFGKPNKTEDAEDNSKKGMLGDASIAELEEKDEKQIKVATGATAGTVLASGVLAVANVLPWLMFVLALLAIAAYVTYRIKKKKDKEKRRAALAAKKAQIEAAKQSVSLEAVQNVNNTVAEDQTVQPVIEETANIETQVEVAPIANPEVAGVSEFSEQPYEPSRDGVTEIAIHPNSEAEKK